MHPTRRATRQTRSYVPDGTTVHDLDERASGFRCEGLALMTQVHAEIVEPIVSGGAGRDADTPPLYRKLMGR